MTYDAESGVLTWLPTCPLKRMVGQPAGGNSTKSRHRQVTIDGVNYRAHHLAWLYVHGFLPDQLDHKDLNGHNNAIANLRIADASQNQANTKTRRDNLSGMKGVRNCGGRWKARIYKNGVAINLGSFSSRELAHEAYKAKAKELFGEFARPS